MPITEKDQCEDIRGDKNKHKGTKAQSKNGLMLEGNRELNAEGIQIIKGLSKLK